MTVRRFRFRLQLIVLAVLGALTSVVAVPAVAEAHGPTAPIATSYLAKADRVPAGLDAQIVDGDLRMWLSVPASTTVEVLDYRGAPYLRYSHAGVQINHNCSMYYLNETPLAQTPPAGLGRTTPPDWQPASSGHSYGWQDGRLAAFAAIALAPGTRYVGEWSVPILVDGRLTAISGGLWYHGAPSIFWFWPVVVMLLCTLAAWRLRRPALDARIARGLGATSLIAFAVAGAARDLHGRPGVTALQLIELAVLLSFVAWGLRRVLLGEPGYFTYLVISFVALWEGISLISTFEHGFVLLALPAFAVRTAAVLCLGAGAGTLMLAFRLADGVRTAPAARRRERSAAA
jgi:hypothetical protein